MTNVALFYSLLVAALTLYGGFYWYGQKKFQRYMRRPFPNSWQEILERRIPVYKRLSNAMQQELEQLIKRFLYYKEFVGCSGFDITDEVRVVVAAEACVLLLNRPNSCYRGLKWIYMYPSTFVAQREQRDEYGVVSQQRSYLLGESWSNGRVVLAWDSVNAGIADPDDGHNVVLHEFAHQLDQEDGRADGAPLLYTRDSYNVWARVFSKEFCTLQTRVSEGRKTLIDEYGATDPAEFFAVVTETFFERPELMYARHQQLFLALQDYYRVDPRSWKS